MPLSRLAIKKTFVASLFAIGSVLINSSPVNALSGGEFKAGNIMDDGVFFNSRSMSVEQIQNFLNSKVPSCDTNGVQMYNSTMTRAEYGAANGSPAPYTCLRHYSQETPNRVAETGLCQAYGGGQKSSAQIIYDVAQACGVNVQVLLVLLQKEQSLITDDWPWPIQYRSATGYGCPDTAPCDSEYYGFFNQVYNAARIYKKYARDTSQYNYRVGRNNNILYNPNSSCGNSSVFLQNQSTTGLYIYTPYQPNKAALDNLYGSGDTCSAYGNRNFWRMFNDWFGSTHGALIRTPTSGALYYTDGQRKFIVPSLNLASQYGLGINDVRYVSQEEMDATPLASTPLSSSIGTVVKSDNDSDADGAALYLVNNRNRIPISSMEQFSNFGFTTEMIRYLPLSTIERLSLSQSNLSDYVQGPDMSLYKIENGKKRIIFELSKYIQLNPGGNLTPLTTITLYNWDYAPPVVDGDYNLIESNGTVRVYRDSSFHVIPSLEVYECLQLSSLKTFRIWTHKMANGTSNGNLSCLVEDSVANISLMAGARRYPISSSLNLPARTRPSDAFINRLSTSSTPAVLKANGQSELSVIESNVIRPIPSMKVFEQLGYDGSSIQTVPAGTYKSLNKGAKKLSLSTLVLEPNGTISVISGVSSRLHITSAQQFEYFGFSWKSLIKSTPTDLSAYASAGTLPNYVRSSGELYLIDEKVRYVFDPSIDVHFGLDRNTILDVNQTIIDKTLPWSMTRFIKNRTNGTVYYMENGQKRPITSWQRVEELGGANSIVILSDKFVASITTGPVI